MGWIVNSIRNRLFLSLFSFVLIIFIQVVISYYSTQQIEKIADLKESLTQLNNDWLNIDNKVFKFISTDIRNLDYFESGKSEFMSEIREVRVEVRRQISALVQDNYIQNFHLTSDFDTLQSLLMEYDHLVDELEHKILLKGFKDHGLEGQMRENIHKLEYSEMIPLDRVLTIRRHEKDYLLRGDTNYLHKLKQVANHQIDILSESSSYQADSEKTILVNYLDLFERYVALNQELGLYDDKGLKREIERCGDLIFTRIEGLKSEFSSKVANQLLLLRSVGVLTAIIVLILSGIISVFLARSLSKPIYELSNRMKDMALVKRKNGGIRKLKNMPEEIRSLNSVYNEMSSKINLQMDEIKKQNVELEKQNVELETLNAELDKFVYHTSHDLRSPLTSVMGLIELIETGDKEDEEEYFSYIKKCVTQLDNTIVDIIRFYKNRTTEVNLEEIDVKQLVSEIIIQNKFHPNALNLTFESQIPQGLTLVSDFYRLSLILRNLISNSIKYQDMTKEFRFVKIQVDQYGDNWKIKLSDNGIGIPEKHQSRIFEMFYRASDQSKGSGLGLFIVLDSVRKIGGEIELNSKEGEGTEFTITLPIHIPLNGSNRKHNGVVESKEVIEI